MTDAAHVEDTLRAQLPAALHAWVLPLTALIAELEARRLTPAEATERLRAEVFARLREQLAGKVLAVDVV
jgi:hypothetical protein